MLSQNVNCIKKIYILINIYINIYILVVENVQDGRKYSSIYKACIFNLKRAAKKQSFHSFLWAREFEIVENIYVWFVC